MKKILVALFVMVLTISVGFSYDEVDKTVGGVGAVGPSAMDRTVVISGEYDFAKNTYDTNDIIKLLTECFCHLTSFFVYFLTVWQN